MPAFDKSVQAFSRLLLVADSPHLLVLASAAFSFKHGHNFIMSPVWPRVRPPSAKLFYTGTLIYSTPLHTPGTRARRIRLPAAACEQQRNTVCSHLLDSSGTAHSTRIVVSNHAATRIVVVRNSTAEQCRCNAWTKHSASGAGSLETCSSSKVMI